MASERKERAPGRRANYGDATPEQVGWALVNYRPARKQVETPPTGETSNPSETQSAGQAQCA